MTTVNNATDSKDYETLLQEFRRLEMENRKLNRQLRIIHDNLENFKRNSEAQANLSAAISAEKSRQEKHMILLLENSPDIIMLLDSEDRFVFCTRSFLKRIGIANYGLIHRRPFQEVFAKFAQPEFIGKLSDKIKETRRLSREKIFDEKIDFSSGESRYCKIYITPIEDDGGESEGVLLVFNDLTEIVSAKEQAVAASRAKTDFLTTVSHEIRTPMNAITGISDMLKKTKLSSHQTELLEKIQGASGILLNLINDILDISKIEAGKLEILEEYYDFPHMLEKIKSVFDIMFRQKNIDFLFIVPEDLPRAVCGDEKRTGQVLTNILNNALKYTNEGRVEFRAHADGNGNIRFSVADTGIGIREEDLPRLFNAFEQLDKVRNKTVVGTGLGLSITRKLCELMDGSIKVTSVYGKGSCFEITLPLRIGSEDQLAAHTVGDSAFKAPGAKILVVDDIEINLIVTSAILEDYGIAPVQASGGFEALELLKTQDYHIIFMDHMMPKIDGIETTKKIRASDCKSARVPIIALTANAVTGAREMFMQSGFSDFISKPVSSGAIHSCLRKWLPQELIREG